jgi:hypothetical protein
MWTVVVWVVTPYGLVGGYQRFGVAEDGGDKLKEGFNHL